MENKIDRLKKERESIVKEYSSKPISRTNIEKEVKNFKETQSVLVSKIIDEAPFVKSFIFVPNKELGTKDLEGFKSGQYISLMVDIDGVTTTRAYSLASSPKEAIKGFYKITVKRVKDGLVSNFLLDNIKVGDALTISNPTGDFGYNKVIDEENVIAVCGGSGVTPFMSLAKSIIEGTENANLTVIYSVRTFDDIIFKEEIANINKTSKKVKFVITLTREEKEGFLHGHINKAMIEPYIKEFNTVLMCGPKAIYKKMNEILLDYNIPRKSVRFENFYNEFEPEEIKTYSLKILNKEMVQEITCLSNETLLVAMEKASIKAPSLCRVGTCGFCRSILVSGKVKMVGAIIPTPLLENEYIHPCVTYPEGDIVLRLDI